MDAQPSGRQLGLATYMGRRFALKNPVYGEPDDAAQDACVALLAEWPKLCAQHPDGVHNGVICAVVTRRLIDRLRTVTGWKRVQRPRPTVPLDGIPERYHPPDTFDTEAEALRGVEGVEAMIERIVRDASYTDRQEVQHRYVLRRLAEGGRQTDIADELGITISRVGQLVARLRAVTG